ncbi:MAG: ribonuclease HII [Defluviitaleaceae bacterium]|nr:ribonuclease HII [Defluviitaleaceae bacterium]
MSNLFFEKKYADLGYDFICGVDEAGAGPLAGPVAAAAVIMPAGLVIDGVNDSKKLSEKKRSNLSQIIIEKALSWHIALVQHDEIDEINILQARMKAMQEAIAGLMPKADFALIDGNRKPELHIPSVAIEGGDTRSFTIACASILAKVSRDAIMVDYHEKYPQYGFDRHKGYGTKAHKEAISQFGLSPIHRQTFCKGYRRNEGT